jgi:hypothetical protein
LGGSWTDLESSGGLDSGDDGYFIFNFKNTGVSSANRIAIRVVGKNSDGDVVEFRFNV